MLVIEDLHWADDATLNLLSALARRRAAARLMVVATCGTGDAAIAEFRRASAEGAETEFADAASVRGDGAGAAFADCGEGAAGAGAGAGGAAAGADGVCAPALGGQSSVCDCDSGAPDRAAIFGARRNERGVAMGTDGAFEEMEADVPERLAQMIELEIEGLSAEEQWILGAGSAMGIAFPAWAVAAALEEDAARLKRRARDWRGGCILWSAADRMSFRTGRGRSFTCLCTGCTARFCTGGRRRRGARRGMCGLRSGWALCLRSACGLWRARWRCILRRPASGGEQ